MENISNLLEAPWPWYVSGMVIVTIMALLLFFGKSFGFSSNFRTLCAACGAGKKVGFFDFNWKAQSWNLFFLVGALIGGFITNQFLGGDQQPNLNPETLASLETLGFSAQNGFLPQELFGSEAWRSPFTWSVLFIGGLLVGFGSRWAGGCTSGHAISGLSDLQLPSLLAVVGFFAGGLLMTHLLMPWIFS